MLFYSSNEQEVPRAPLTANSKDCLHLSRETGFTPNKEVFWYLQCVFVLISTPLKRDAGTFTHSLGVNWEHLKPPSARSLEDRDLAHSMAHHYLLEETASPSSQATFSKSVFGHIKHIGQLPDFSYSRFLAEQQFPFSSQSRPLIPVVVKKSRLRWYGRAHAIEISKR